jgi:hypothetical protein
MASSQQRITKCGAGTHEYVQARKETSVLKKATVQIKNHLPAPFTVTMQQPTDNYYSNEREQKKHI